MIITEIERGKIIIPNRFKHKGIFRKIHEVLDPAYIINKYIVKFIKGRNIIVSVKIDALHPNCNPRTGKFCLPDNLKWDEARSFNILETMFRTFNMDDSYDQPWEAFSYVKEN